MRMGRTTAGIGATGCLLSLAACSSPSPGPTSSTTAVPATPSASSSSSGSTISPTLSGSSSTSDAPGDVRAVALTTYRAMWADMVEAGKTADYQSPAMAHHAASQALQLLVGGLYDAHQKKIVIKGEPTFDPQVTSVTTPEHPVAVAITDCMDDSRWLDYRAADGQLEGSTPGGRHHATATVGLLDGVWKVTRLQVQGVGTC